MKQNYPSTAEDLAHLIQSTALLLFIIKIFKEHFHGKNQTAGNLITKLQKKKLQKFIIVEFSK